MPRVRRRRKRRSRQAFALIVGATLTLVVLGAALRHHSRRRAVRANLENTAAALEYEPFSAPLGFSQPNRVVYPYSVIPGGAHTLEELRAAEAREAVVRSHYADFNHARFRIVQLDHGEKVYVSYRIGNEIFWTRNRIHLPPGEELMTDGVFYARTRCGNRLSAVPREKTSVLQPSLALLESPRVYALAPAGGTLPVGHALDYLPSEAIPLPLQRLDLPAPPAILTGPVSPPAPVFFPGGVVPSPGNEGNPNTPVRPLSPPLSVTPEPGCLWLLSSALGLFALYWRRLRRKHCQ
jgi:hypothetical protein